MTKRQCLSAVIIITSKETELLHDCLNSVSWADEIILLDSGKKDITLSIAHHYGAKVFRSQSWPGYGKQRQQAQEYAGGDMILMIDADERVTPELRAAIEQVLNSAPQLDKVYSLRRLNLFLGRFMRHSGWYPDHIVRLYPRSYRYSNDQVHESLETGTAQVVVMPGYLKHLTCRDFITFQRKQLAYAEAWAQQQHQKGKYCSIFSIFIHMLGAFCKTLLLRVGFLDGQRGWILAIVNAQYTFNKRAALWSLHQEATGK